MSNSGGRPAAPCPVRRNALSPQGVSVRGRSGRRLKGQAVTFRAGRTVGRSIPPRSRRAGVCRRSAARVPRGEVEHCAWADVLVVPSLAEGRPTSPRSARRGSAGYRHHCGRHAGRREPVGTHRSGGRRSGPGGSRRGLPVGPCDVAGPLDRARQTQASSASASDYGQRLSVGPDLRARSGDGGPIHSSSSGSLPS